MGSCYWVDGSLWASSDQLQLMPCDPNAKVSPCCNAPNYCLDNGLCLDTNTEGIGNNIFSIQGCTDPNWPPPCNRYCQNPSPRSYINLLECQAGPGYDYYCCGSDISSCSNTAALVKIAAATWLSLPGGGAATSTLTNPSTTSTSPSTSLPPTPPTPTQGAIQPSSQQGAGEDRSVAIGLGAGIPLAVLFIAVITFTGWQLKRSNDLKRPTVGPQIPAIEIMPHPMH
ncbi:hypothetical protein V8E54_009935 [Elaphomyces granulatus]